MSGDTTLDQLRKKLAASRDSGVSTRTVDEICAEAREIAKVPNTVTARTLRKADRGEDLVRSRNAADLFRKLGN
jgi:hypothetical protein